MDESRDRRFDQGGEISGLRRSNRVCHRRAGSVASRLIAVSVFLNKVIKLT